MELTNLNLKKEFSHLENPEIGQKASENFSDIGVEKLQALKDSISEIKKMIEERGILSQHIYDEGEQIKSEINRHLEENDKIKIGGADITKEKNDLRHKKVEISELQLNEKINCWKDIAVLKKELREYERELTEKQDRLNMLNKIMENN